MRGGLVSPRWFVCFVVCFLNLLTRLASELSSVRVIDATWALPGSAFVTEGSPEEAYRKQRIPTAKFWDLDKYSDDSASLAPHNCPTPNQFAEAASKCGIVKESKVVVYDQFGIFSSPKLWFTLRAFGVDCAVLNGGLPAWIAAGHALESTTPDAMEAPREEWTMRDVQWRFDDIEAWLGDDQRRVLLDARSKGRFDGTAPDPRGLRSGHIPYSVNVPFTDLLVPGDLATTEGKHGGPYRGATFADDVTLRSLLPAPGPVAVTCGSGMTAATLALGLHRIGNNDIHLYDGSWLDYASRPDAPVEITPSSDPSSS